MKINLSSVNRLAWKIKKTGKSWSESLKAAYKTLKAKAELKQSVCRISFQKTDGTITERVGTLRPDFLPSLKGGSRVSTSAKITFWSLTDNGFRSFLPQNLISVKVEAVELAAAA